MSILGALIVAFNFQLSYGNSEFTLWENSREAYVIHNFITPELNVEARLGLAYIGGGISVPVVRDKRQAHVMGGFNPKQAAFPFSVGVKGKHFDLGYTYSCHHPFFTYLDGDAYNKEVKSRVEGGVWKVFVKFSGEFQPFERK